MTHAAAVTGHTAGIGLAISEMLGESGYDVRGFSRSTGHELPQAVDRIVDEADDCDVFVNNAFVYHDFTQVELLYKLYLRWNEIEGKTIINISSRAGDFSNSGRIDGYSMIKHALDTASRQLSNVRQSKCRVVNIKPGWVDTASVRSVDVFKLAPQDVAEAVGWILERPSRVYVTSISLQPMG